MPKFKKKPIVIEARRIDTRDGESLQELAKWCLGKVGYNSKAEPGILIDTLEGLMRAEYGDWIIKGVQGEFYGCKDSVFKESYEQVEW